MGVTVEILYLSDKSSVIHNCYSANGSAGVPGSLFDLHMTSLDLHATQKSQFSPTHENTAKGNAVQ